MRRIVPWTLLLSVVTAGPLEAQLSITRDATQGLPLAAAVLADRVQDATPTPPLAWLSLSGGVGTAGMSGGLGLNLAQRGWTLSGRYAKSLASDSSSEDYIETIGVLLGRLIHSAEGRGAGSIAFGVGRISGWTENQRPCSPSADFSCSFGSQRRTGRSDESEGFGALVEATFYPSANGGSFTFGLQLLGAIGGENTHFGVGITLGLGSTP